MQDTIAYILSFLLAENPANKNLITASPHHRITASSYIGYTANRAEWTQYKVVIVPSSFFQDHAAGKVKMPSLPLAQLDGMPILFGQPKHERMHHTLVLYADLVASAFFLLSRYEETLNPVRDAHGRFQAVSSLAYRAGFLQRPLVDEYGAYLKKCLQQCGVELPQTSAKMHITLTHDVDVPFEHRTLRSFLGGIARGQVKNAFKNAFSSLENNTAYTFPWLLQQDDQLADAEKIYFLRYPVAKCPQDKPYLSYQSSDMKQLLNLLQKYPVQWGLHGSYLSGKEEKWLSVEKNALEKCIGKEIFHHRYHYLRTCIADNFISLQEVGILHDYTVGYADAVGFRLGTCRPVRFISPTTLQVGSVVLHPLSIMDVTLSQYMQLTYQQAWDVSLQIIQQVQKYQGELVLLWHNTSVVNHGYHKTLYQRIINHLNASCQSV
jgi:hypothetical protein